MIKKCFLLILLALTLVFTACTKEPETKVTVDIQKPFLYSNVIYLNDSVLAERLTTISYGTEIQNPYGVNCIEKIETLTTIDNETLNTNKQLVYFDDSGSQFLCGYYSEAFLKYNFYLNTNATPNGLILTYSRQLPVGTEINNISYGQGESCVRKIVGTKDIVLRGVSYVTDEISYQCSRDGEEYYLTSYYSPFLYIVLKEEEVIITSDKVLRSSKELLEIN